MPFETLGKTPGGQSVSLAPERVSAQLELDKKGIYKFDNSSS